MTISSEPIGSSSTGAPLPAGLLFRALWGVTAATTFQFRVLAASQPYASLPTDDMPNQLFVGRLLKSLRFDRSIISGGAFGKMSIGVGELELANSDGFYDHYVEQYVLNGRRVIVKIGALGESYDSFRTIYTGTALGWNADEDVLRVSLRDHGYKLQVPVSPNVYTGLGDVEGLTDLTSKRKPLAFGYVDNVTPALVIPSELLYQVHDGPVQAIPAVFDRGSQLTLSADYSSVAELRAATIPGGSYGTCLDQGLFRLGAAPGGTITADVEGDKTTGVFASTTVQIIRRILNRSTDIVDPDDLLTGSFVDLEQDQPAAIGYYVAPGSDETARSVIDKLLNGVGAWGDFRRDGLFYLGRLEMPLGAPAITYKKEQILSISRQRLPSGIDPPPWRFRCVWGRNWTTQTDLAGTVPADRVAYLAQEFRTAAAANTALGVQIQDTYPMAQDPAPVESYFRREADAQTEADRLLVLYKPLRALYRIKLKLQPLIHEVGDVIRVSYPRGGTRLMRIVDISEDLDGRQVELQAFG